MSADHSDSVEEYFGGLHISSWQADHYVRHSLQCYVKLYIANDW